MGLFGKKKPATDTDTATVPIPPATGAVAGKDNKAVAQAKPADKVSAKNAPATPKSNVPTTIPLEDIIAPAEMEVDFSFLRINTEYYRSFFVSGYPRYVEPNWLSPLISFDHTLDVSMF